MTEQSLKVSVGLTVIVSHFVLVILVIILYAWGGFLYEEMTTIIALIVPMFSIYTSAVIKYLIENKAKIEDKSGMVTSSFIFISFFLPLLFIAMLAIAIIMKAYNVAFSTFDELKLMLGILQTAFGVYMGVLLSSLFDIKEEHAK